MRKQSWRCDVSSDKRVRNTTLDLAIRVMMKWRNRTPSPDELIRAYGMSRATAHRWSGAIKDARGLA